MHTMGKSPLFDIFNGQENAESSYESSVNGVMHASSHSLIPYPCSTDAITTEIP